MKEDRWLNHYMKQLQEILGEFSLEDYTKIENEMRDAFWLAYEIGADDNEN